MGASSTDRSRAPCTATGNDYQVRSAADQRLPNRTSAEDRWVRSARGAVMTLADVREFCVPADIVADTEIALRRAGGEGYEAFVLWSGRQTETSFAVRT